MIDLRQARSLQRCSSAIRRIARRIHPREHLKGFEGVLQADGYAGFDALYERTPRPLLEAACWAHVRRKFYEVHVADQSPIAREALERIGALYEIEEQIRGRSADERQSVRLARAGPILTDLHTWLTEQVRRLSKKSELAGAIRYALTRWAALMRYATDGSIEIDNNAAERALRAVALGRKNYLFAGSDVGGEHRGGNLYAYRHRKTQRIGTSGLSHVRALTHREYPINRIAELMPWNVAPNLTHLPTLAA